AALRPGGHHGPDPYAAGRLARAGRHLAGCHLPAVPCPAGSAGLIRRTWAPNLRYSRSAGRSCSVSALLSCHDDARACCRARIDVTISSTAESTASAAIFTEPRGSSTKATRISLHRCGAMLPGELAAAGAAAAAGDATASVRILAAAGDPSAAAD